MKATMAQYETLFGPARFQSILPRKDWPYSVNTVFNAGAALLPNDSTFLLCRV